MNEAQVLVSVLMPMRNAEQYVAEALQSVLSERDVPLEVIVVDDGSSDGSRLAVEAMQDARIRLVDGPRQGIAAAFNAGLAQARGGVVMRCDADDLYPSGRIRRQITWLNEHGDFGAVCGAFVAIGERTRASIPLSMSSSETEISSELRAGTIRTSYCTFAVRAPLLRTLGGARAYFVTGEDADLQLRLSELCRIWYSPDIAYKYRLHDSSITHSAQSAAREFFEQQARLFQSQRQSHGLDDLQRGVAAALPAGLTADVNGATSHLRALLTGAMWSASQRGDISTAWNMGAELIRLNPRSVGTWWQALLASAKAIRPRKSN